jgi:hypothetical protein
MYTRCAVVLIGLVLAVPARCEYAVVIGSGISNKYFGDIKCGPDEVCLDAVFLWTLRVDRTVAGPAVTGVIDAVTAQHVEMLPEYVRSTELFVLQSAERVDGCIGSCIHWSLVSSSRRLSGDRYCISIDPTKVGLSLEPQQIKVDEYGYYCFKRSALAARHGA